MKTSESRDDREKSLELEKRKELYRIIRTSPGLHFREIQRRTDSGTGQLEYHLEYLKKVGLILSEKNRGIPAVLSPGRDHAGREASPRTRTPKKRPQDSPAPSGERILQPRRAGDTTWTYPHRQSPGISPRSSMQESSIKRLTGGKHCTRLRIRN